jgi:murein DD-endopeptidase MepM/ murein hydrolase activator NlpD
MNTFSKFLEEISSKSHYVLDTNIPLSKYIPIDLSINNKLLHDVDVSSSTNLGDFINNHIKKQEGKIGFGGYNETRNIYQRSIHFNKLDADSERNIHLGVDLWADAETPIYAPLDATVHSFKNNINFADYGPTIILKHLIKDTTFFTLYGHLSLNSIASLMVGQVFKRGDKIGTLGDASVNGDYPPHLHFQIIKDIQHYKGDYPGVCNTKDLNFYLKNCPNPNLLLKLEA